MILEDKRPTIIEDEVITFKFVKDFMKCSDSKAYQLIRRANKLMLNDGYNLQMRGRTTKAYFYKLIGCNIIK